MTNAKSSDGRVVVIFVALILLLLLMPFDVARDRLTKEILNIGHIVLFATLTILLLRATPTLSNMAFAWQIATVAVVFAFIGMITEALQAYTQRTPSWRDVGLDVAGGVLAVTFFSKQLNGWGWRTKYLLRAVALLVVLIMMMPGVKVAADAWFMYRQFPVLTDMSTPFELSRWGGGGNRVTREFAAEASRYRLRADLRLSAFSGISLDDFIRNWQGYDKLVFEFDNPGAQSLEVTIRINDLMHERGQQVYLDRFNYHTTLPPGKQRIALALNDIAKAPKGRVLNLAEVAKIVIFTTKLKRPAVLFIDRIYLSSL